MNYDHGRQHNFTGPGSNRQIIVTALTKYLEDVCGVASMMVAHPGRHEFQPNWM